MGRKFRLTVSLLLLCLSLMLASCSENVTNMDSATPSNIPTPTLSESASPGQETPASENVVFTYELQNETYQKGTTRIEFPQLVKTSDLKKGDRINDAIQEGLMAYLLRIKDENRSNGTVVLDLHFETNTYEDKALTVIYTGTMNIEGNDTRVFHTQVINLVEDATITLWDAFAIDEDFIDQYRNGLYSPSEGHANLEEMNVDLKGLIDSQYSPGAMKEMLKSDTTEFVLTSLGVIVSITVSPEYGDHLEMAIPYEAIELQMKRDDCTVWKDYLAMGDNGPEELSAAGYQMAQYQNARFGFSLSYPDIFTAPVEADNGDGITLESADGRHSLLIWAGNNLEETDGAGLLEAAKEGIANIREESALGARYSVTFEGGDKDQILFVQKGFAGSIASVHFRISFPLEEEGDFTDILARMESELNVE